jgi:hypothetical protein
MNQKSSLREVPHFVSGVLTGNTFFRACSGKAATGITSYEAADVGSDKLTAKAARDASRIVGLFNEASHGISSRKQRHDHSLIGGD